MKLVDSALRNQLICAKFTDLELHRMYLLCKGNRLSFVIIYWACTGV